MTQELEVEHEPELVYNLTAGTITEGLRVRYRPLGTRRWTRFLFLLSEEDMQSSEELEELARVAARAHFMRKVLGV